MKLNSQRNLSYLEAVWPQNCPAKPDNVHAYTTLVTGGYSKGDYSTFNLASHVGDDPQAVRSNRAKLVQDLGLPAKPAWLEQVHSNTVCIVDEPADLPVSGAADLMSGIRADASISRSKDVVCAVLTADCLPVFFCNRSGTEVGAAHAGWRGLHAGILTNTVKAMNASPEDILVSLGPAISVKAFEVGEEVYQAFLAKNSKNESAFTKAEKYHYFCDIYKLATFELQSIGVNYIAGGHYCTYSESERFYSYRRQKNTGRIASVIWMG